ncbi:hypothetical protein M413DRAFT_445026 [Hebeloma cylindrosporum]|uniref:Uncharacterized protein n=1 Tax=Hebeloma cylindrosporum TaxID=76867 RepID=A0A0C3CC37_HEBCY|nr:hypothetical protein M413DRAFT_445026 [Hebeloma cylindrosporum h7]
MGSLTLYPVHYLQSILVANARVSVSFFRLFNHLSAWTRLVDIHNNGFPSKIKDAGSADVASRLVTLIKLKQGKGRYN